MLTVDKHAAAHQVAVQGQLVVQNFVSLDLDIGGLALGTTQRLMDHDAAVGEAVALALRDDKTRQCQWCRHRHDAAKQ